MAGNNLKNYQTLIFFCNMMLLQKSTLFVIYSSVIVRFVAFTRNFTMGYLSLKMPPPPTYIL